MVHGVLNIQKWHTFLSMSYSTTNYIVVSQSTNIFAVLTND